MKKRKMAGAAGAAFLLAACLSFPAGGTKQDMEAAKDKVSALEEEKQKVEAALQNLEGLKADTAAYVRELDNSLAAISGEIELLEGQILLKEEEIGNTWEELEKARERERRQYEAMKLRIQYMYEKGDTSFITMLLESESISELLSRGEYISQISRYDREQLKEYAASRQDIAVHEARLQSEREELLAFQEETAARHASVEELLAAKEGELARYEAGIASARAQVDEYQRDIAAQEARIKELEEEIRRKEEEERKRAEAAKKPYTTASLGNISFIWPCPSSARITSGFGNRSSPMEGASASHQGIDIGAGTGSSIVAAADGTVLIADYSYSAGNYLTISHGGGVSTVYMHCSKLNVSAGESVKQGQVIGAVGSTGYSTGPHLHFGIRSGGSYVDPSNYVSP